MRPVSHFPSLQAAVIFAALTFGTARMCSQQPVWGFADLHTHPASHLSFGATEKGNGIFWGKPGLDLSTAAANLGTDMPPCLTTNMVLFPDPLLVFPFGLVLPPTLPLPITSLHGAPVDFIQLETQRVLISSVDAQVNMPHHEHGAPGFEDWPSALIVEHQQMHITAIKRAYDGGLRLMMADAVDSQLLSTLWSKVGFNYAPSVPNPDPNFDYNSAIKQLTFIQSLAAANSSWMQIVKSPAEARQAINSNKLAIVLGLEMDSLTLDQILSLVSTFGVRHVIPIHLANGHFGGTAVYQDIFNTNSWFLNNHQFFTVDFDPKIPFRLSVPQALQAFPGGAILPTSISNDEYKALGYDQGTGGHKNNMGLSAPQSFTALMRAALLIDVAHMSEKATEMALTQAETYGYPLMDSHTGLRTGKDADHSNERALLPSHAGRIGNLGGVIGLGPAWNGAPNCTDSSSRDPISDFLTDFQYALQQMGGRGVALGTDANGLQPLINCTKQPLRNVPITVASRFSPPPGVPTPSLPEYQLGTREQPFDIQRDGIANYAMLPDFLEALSEQSASQPAPVVAELYKSAEDVIQMWEKVVSVSSNVVPPGIVCQQPGYGQCIQTAESNFTDCIKQSFEYTSGHREVCLNTRSSALTACFNQFCSAPQITRLTVKERLFPSMDTGRFKLSIDGIVELANVGDQADTGFVNVGTGVHLVSEGSEGATNLANYLVQFGGDCVSSDTSHGPFTRPVAINVGEQKTCTITNKGFPALAFTFTTPAGNVGTLNIQVDQATVGNSSTANGMTVRITNLSGANHTISVVPADSHTNPNGYVVVFGRDCSKSSGSQVNGVVTLSAGDEKLCMIQVLPPGQGGCSAGQRSCGQAAGHPPLCVEQGVSCDALCKPDTHGKQGIFCDVGGNGQPVCVYPPAECQ